VSEKCDIAKKEKDKETITEVQKEDTERRPLL